MIILIRTVTFCVLCSYGFDQPFDQGIDINTFLYSQYSESTSLCAFGKNIVKYLCVLKIKSNIN